MPATSNTADKDTLIGRYESSALSALTMRRYRRVTPGEDMVSITTYAKWEQLFVETWGTEGQEEEGETENFLPVIAVVEIRDVSGEVGGRIEAEYSVWFDTRRNVEPGERTGILAQVLPDFWEDAGKFLGQALEQIGFSRTLLQNVRKAETSS